TPAAAANEFLAFTGFRRHEATVRTPADLMGARVLEFKSKTRVMRVPLSQQAAALIDRNSETTLLRASENQLRTPLNKIFGVRALANGRTKSRVTPHDLRRLLKTVATELKIDPVIRNILVGHSLRGVD